MNMHQSADLQPRQVLLLGSRSQHTSMLMAFGLGLVRGPGQAQTSELGAFTGAFQHCWVSSLDWSAVFPDHSFPLVISVVLGFSVQTPCVMLLLCFLHLTGMSNPSPSLPDEILFLCLRFILPQHQTTSWTFHREVFGKISLFWSTSVCTHLFCSEAQTYLTLM